MPMQTTQVKRFLKILEYFARAYTSLKGIQTSLTCSQAGQVPFISISCHRLARNKEELVASLPVRLTYSEPKKSQSKEDPKQKIGCRYFFVGGCGSCENYLDC